VAAPGMNGARTDRLNFTILLLTVGTNVGLLAIARQPSLSVPYVLGSLMLWISVFPVWRYFRDQEREIPFLPAMTVIYFLYYGLPIFTRTLKVRATRLEGDPVDAALALACGGELLMLLAFYLVKRMRSLPRLRLALDLEHHAPAGARLGTRDCALGLDAHGRIGDRRQPRHVRQLPPRRVSRRIVHGVSARRTAAAPPAPR
jgi:hypothetical protein